MSYYPGQARTSRTLTSLVLFVIGICLTVGLYYVKTRAQSAKKEAVRLERLVVTEQAALNVLKAELAYLSGPDRVGKLARTELGLTSITTKQIISLNDLDERFPIIVETQGDQN